MTRQEALVRVLCTRYPLLGRETIANTVSKLLAVLRSGKNTDFDGEPLRVFANPVEYFKWVLDFNHAGRKNYEYLFGDRALAEKAMRAEPPRQAKHDPSRNEYQRKYQKKRYHGRKKQAIKMLGGKCVKCDSTSNLELDHKDPSDKSFTITKLWSVPEEEFKKEVRKCRLLCREHHLEHTGSQREKGEVKSKPGKSEYGDDNRKKASTRIQHLIKALAFDDAAQIGAAIAKQVASAHDGVDAYVASDFSKHDQMDRPAVTWNVFDGEDGGYQVLFRVYGREKDGGMIKSILDSVKESLPSSGAIFDYEDDLSEPGLIVKTVSGLCR